MTIARFDTSKFPSRLVTDGFARAPHRRSAARHRAVADHVSRMVLGTIGTRGADGPKTSLTARANSQACSILGWKGPRETTSLTSDMGTYALQPDGADDCVGIHLGDAPEAHAFRGL